MRLHAHLSVVLLILLAGCSSPSSDDGDDPSMTLTGTDGTSASTQVAAAEAADPLPVTVTCTQTRTNVGTTTGYGLNIDRAATGLDFCMLEDLFDGDISWAQAGLVEATWTNQPSQTGTDLWLESDACPPNLPPGTCMPPHTMGSTSPLSLELTAEELRTAEGKNPSVMASGQGVVNGLEYTFYITLFPTEVIPSGFTAVP